MKTYVINLASDIDRKNFQQEQLKRLEIECEFITATPVDVIPQETFDHHYFDWQRPLRKVEVACYYSHRAAWQRILDENKPALILEDDALLSLHSKELLNTLDCLKDADYVQLEARSRKKLLAKKGIAFTTTSKLHRLYLDRTGAAGYVLWPSGAKKLIERERKKGIGLADAHITACFDLVAYQVEPAVVIQLDQCEKFHITAPLDTKSNILNQPKPVDKNKLFFKFKRITSQIRMAIRLLRFAFRAERREVLLINKDFYSG
jgi:glycosyl transferase family 25